MGPRREPEGGGRRADVPRQELAQGRARNEGADPILGAAKAVRAGALLVGQDAGVNRAALRVEKDPPDVNFPGHERRRDAAPLRGEERTKEPRRGRRGKR